MKKMLTLLLSLISVPGFAASWRYIVYEGGVQSYAGPRPPVDLTYPPLGEPTPAMQAGDIQRGIIQTPAEAAARLSQPQIIIVPPGSTGGGQLSGTSATLR